MRARAVIHGVDFAGDRGGFRCAGERFGRKVTALARGAGLAAGRGRRGRWRSGRGVRRGPRALAGGVKREGGGETRGLRVAERAGAKQAAVEWGRDGAGRG